MSLLSKYYYRRYMVKTLTNRVNKYEEGLNDIISEVNEVRSVLSTVNESYESASQGFFASAGTVLSKN